MAGTISMLDPSDVTVATKPGCPVLAPSEAISGARGGEISRALSAAREWTWLGHAIVSPGWRLESGADDLIRLTKNRAGAGGCASDIIAP